jgi:hypothetical protein
MKLHAEEETMSLYEELGGEPAVDAAVDISDRGVRRP